MSRKWYNNLTQDHQDLHLVYKLYLILLVFFALIFFDVDCDRFPIDFEVDRFPLDFEVDPLMTILMLIDLMTISRREPLTHADQSADLKFSFLFLFWV